MVDEILIKWPRLTTAQVILALTMFIAIWLGFLTVDIQYNRQISFINQNNLVTLSNDTHALLERQGNISIAQRQQLLNQFVNITEHGGFVTQEDIKENKAIIADLNHSFAATDLKLDKLLNQTLTR